MPKIVDRDEYRKEMLSKCFELFSRKGYSNITMREIARELNVSTGTLYHYFPTKRSIFESMFEQQQLIDIEQVLSEIMDITDKPELIDRVLIHWDEKKDFYQNMTLLALDFFRSNEAAPDQNALTHFTEQYREAISKNLGVSNQLASMIFIFVVGLNYSSILVPSMVDFMGQLKLMKGLVLTYMEGQVGEDLKEHGSDDRDGAGLSDQV